MTIRLKRWAPLAAAAALIILSFFIGSGKADTIETSASAARILIIDAGHGGEDGGAVSADGTVESGINLSISLRLNALARLCGLETVMTRETEQIDYPPDAGTTAERKRYDQHRRVDVINTYQDAVLISIHQNCFPDARPSGSQVLYAGNDESRELAVIMHEALTAAVCPQNRRVAAPVSKDIFLMRSVHCPAVLAECGFLSNPQEVEQLRSSGHQIKISAAILTSYMRFSGVREGIDT